MRPIAYAMAVAFLAAVRCAQAAEPPALLLPLPCRLGHDCWILNYPDADPGEAAKDFRCGFRSYNKHDGTDFAVRDRKAMDAGVPALAAAAGRVVEVRDGEDDGLWLAGRQSEVLQRRRECGNRVAIAHGGGWVTDYCHLRKGSVRVQKGETVAAGQPIGLVGLSGMTEFPHLHVSLLRFSGSGPGTPVDPFTGADLAAGCGQPGRPLWSPAFGYHGATIYAAGFNDHVPTKDEAMDDAGERERLPASAAQLAFWVNIFGIHEGDEIHMRIIRPDGSTLFNATSRWPKSQAWVRPAAVKPRPDAGWPPGVYRGEITLRPQSGAATTRTTTVRVE